MTASQTVVPDWRRPARLGYLTVFLTFGVLGGWSAVARLDSAVVAPGVVAVESSRKTIQHLEGGIVQDIRVHEGQHVDEGQVLILIAGTQSQANADAARNQLAASVAQEARLVAERNDAEDIIFPAEIADNLDRSVIAQAVADQRKQFTERRGSLNGQIAILQNRIKQFETEIEGLTKEKDATVRQLQLINEELDDLQSLLEKHLVQKSRVLALDREKSRLEGAIGRSIADAAKAQNGIGEAQLQIDQQRKKFYEEVNAAIVDVRQKIADLREKVTISSDILQRIEIRAPLAGSVQNLKVSTIGGVVRAGESLFDLVPDGDELVVNAQVSPIDISALKLDMKAEVRFNSFHAQFLPVVMGQVRSISRDRLTEEQTKQPYFLARVVVDESNIPSEMHGRIVAGMPVEVVIPTGERTVLNYLVRPLRNRARQALREQ